MTNYVWASISQYYGPNDCSFQQCTAAVQQ